MSAPYETKTMPVVDWSALAGRIIQAGDRAAAIHVQLEADGHALLSSEELAEFPAPCDRAALRITGRVN